MREFTSDHTGLNGEIQLAQGLDVSYGYCFDAGIDEYCYLN